MSFSESVVKLVESSESGVLAIASWWERVPLSNVVDVLNGFPFPSELFNETDGLPLLRIRDVTAGDTKTYFRGSADDVYWVEQGDIVVGMDGDFNLRMWSGKRALLNQRVCKLTPDPRFMSRRFLAHALPGYLGLINGATHSVTVKHLSSRTIQEIPLPLPSISEQVRIADKIDALFERSRSARDELAQVPKLVERYRQAVLEAAFRGDLTKDWRDKRPNESVVVGADTPSLVPYEVPGSWKWERLPNLGLLGRGKSRHRPRNDPSLYGGAYPFIQTGDVRAADGCLSAYTQTYNEKGVAQSKLWPKGTVCITIAANIAETAVLNMDACFPDSIVGFCADQKICRPTYIEYFIRTVRCDLEAFAPATAQKNINLDTLAEVIVPIPPIAEQDEIIKRISSVFDFISALAKQCELADALVARLDQAILDKAFRGELVPQDPDDEPASELLERIRAARADAPRPRRGRRPSDRTSA